MESKWRLLLKKAIFMESTWSRGVHVESVESMRTLWGRVKYTLSMAALDQFFKLELVSDLLSFHIKTRLIFLR